MLSALYTMTSREIIARLVEANLSANFTTRQAFDAITYGLVDPTQGDMRKLASLLQRQGLRKLRATVDGRREYVWLRNPDGLPSEAGAPECAKSDLIERWLRERSAEPFELHDLCTAVYGFEYTQLEMRRAGAYLRYMGYAKRRVMEDGYRINLWQEVE